jgi:hypothetical protein
MLNVKRLALALIVGLGVTGCLRFARGDGPWLAIVLYWDVEPEPETDDSDNYSGGTCRSARADTMEWTLYDQNGDVVDGREEACADAIDVIEPKPGVYQLEITGFDRDGEARWAVCCQGLRVLRFDVVYACDIADNGSLVEGRRHCSD